VGAGRRFEETCVALPAAVIAVRTPATGCCIGVVRVFMVFSLIR